MFWAISVLFLGCHIQSTFTKDISTHLQNGTASFTVNLQKLVHEPGKNTLFSPLTLYTNLALILLGSDGITREEILQLLALAEGTNSEEIHEHFKSVFADIRGSKEAQVEIADGVFIENTFQILESYSKRAKHFYDSEVEKVDFQTDGANAMKTVNDWVSGKTHGRIRNVVTEPFARNTTLVLASSLYFSSNWTYTFSKHSTRLEQFKSHNEEFQVNMMTNQKSIPYADFPQYKYQAISLPYEQNHFSMYIILPYTNETVDNLIRELSADQLLRTISTTTQQRTEVHYKIPQMKFNWKQNLINEFTVLGLDTLFRNANLSNISAERNRIRVSKMTHAAEIEVDESGTIATAVAVTEFMIVRPAAPPSPNPVQFYVDRPFMFLIYHHRTNTILFVGVVYKPK